MSGICSRFAAVAADIMRLVLKMSTNQKTSKQACFQRHVPSPLWNMGDMGVCDIKNISIIITAFYKRL